VQRRPRPNRPRPDDGVTPIKSALGAFLKANQLLGAAKRPRLEATWSRIVGPEFAGHTRVLGFRKGTLEIGVESSALMNEIRFHQAALLADLQREVSRPAIARISFSLIPTRESDEEFAEA
jgi:predicted nucleic acid-binding Zn ribbon protein